jgi:hypothetical protein
MFRVFYVRFQMGICARRTTETFAASAIQNGPVRIKRYCRSLTAPRRKNRFVYRTDFVGVSLGVFWSLPRRRGRYFSSLDVRQMSLLRYQQPVFGRLSLIEKSSISVSWEVTSGC